ncbi:MAG: hypothetical protein IT433_04715 [Phycisphaerales bacterium]|nr:hypothetical protein [Phycisphaerales bacterium]
MAACGSSSGWVLGVLVMLGVVLSASLGGCEGLPDAVALRDRAGVMQEVVHADVAAQRDVVERMREAGEDPDSAGMRDATAVLAQMEARARTLDAAVGELDALIAEATNPTHPISEGVELISRSLPEPLRSPVVLGGALLAMAVRANRLRAALASVAQSIEKAKQNDEQFRRSFKENAPTIRSIQTPTARSIVEAATSQGFTLSLPL